MLGVAIVTVFVFVGSEETIDAPRISNGAGARGGVGQPPPAALPLVRIEGGAPPPRGPARLRFEQGERARLRIVSDRPLTLAIPGYGVREDVGAGHSILSFRAHRAGQYPLVVAGTSIGVASLRVAPAP